MICYLAISLFVYRAYMIVENLGFRFRFPSYLDGWVFPTSLLMIVGCLFDWIGMVADIERNTGLNALGGCKGG